MRVISDDGVGLEVERAGSGPPLVMVHGINGAKDDFADHLLRFADHASVVTFDHRGHGVSDKPAEVAAYSLDRLAADTLAVIDALGFDRVRLLGHSMGGMVARRLVLAHPERVEALVLMNTSSGPPHGIDRELAEYAADVALTDGMDVLRALLDEADVLGSEADQRVRAERPGYIEFGERKWASVAPEAYAALLRDIVRQPNQLDALREIVCPALVVVGEQDTAFVDDSRAMAGAMPQATLAVISDAGHSPQFEAPEAWFAAVDGFVRALPEQAAA
jgi:pimeloyl-ACP methyl ester carboxylesterase